MNPFNLYEAYAAVYDEDLRDELEVIDEDLSFIDDLSDNELTQIMEEILRDGEVGLNECYYAFDEEVLTEARVTTGRGGEATRGGRVTYSKGEEERRARVGRKHAAKRLQVATGRAAERIRAGVEGAKTKGAGAISAMAGGAAEAGRKGKAAAQRVGGKLAAAKERISGFVKRVGRAAGAGASAFGAGLSAARRAGVEAARAEYMRDRAESGRQRGASTNAPERKALLGAPARKALAAAPERKSLPGVPERKAITGTPERKSLPAAATPAPESARRKAAKAKIAKAVSGSVAKGTRFAGPGGSLASQRASTGKQEALARFRKKAGIAEEYLDMILDNILEEIIYEGYAADYDEALYVFEEIGMADLGELAESYLVEELDFEDWVEGLWEEGYDLSDYTWEGLYEAYIDERNRGEQGMSDAQVRYRRDTRDFGHIPGGISGGVRLGGQKRKEHDDQRGRKKMRGRVLPHMRGPNDNVSDYHAVRGKKGLPESYDAYDAILEYILDEGYAETVEDATTIMANMSEEWRDEIIGEANKGERRLNLSPDEIVQRRQTSAFPFLKSGYRGEAERIERRNWQRKGSGRVKGGDPSLGKTIWQGGRAPDGDVDRMRRIEHQRSRGKKRN